MKLLLINPPEGFPALLSPLPQGVTVASAPEGSAHDSAYDFVITFVHHKANIDQYAPTAISAVKAGGHVWFAYPKKTSKINTDIHRDAGWDTVEAAGWGGVRQISIDEVWSALRFRPESEVERKGSKRIKPA
jgi:hypothetical protein